MENLHFHSILFFLSILLFFQFSSLSVASSAYTPPQQYFINCGSDSSSTVTGSTQRTFVADVNSGASAGFSIGPSGSPVKATNPSADLPLLYQTARVFKDPSWYELEIPRNGTYVVRLHFYPFSFERNLFDAFFDVSASGYLILSNFTAPKNSTNSPVIKEFLLSINVGKFRINFMPSKDSSFAFVNAIEAFLAPDRFIPDAASHVSPTGSNGKDYDGLLSRVLHVTYRINVGGLTLTPDNDTLWRNWVPDDDYLYYRDTAKNSVLYSYRPKYYDGGATEYDAPDLVYKTAKELKIDANRISNFSNITWNFGVSKNASYLVRVHFCDIISRAVFAPNFLQFNLYIFSRFSRFINPYQVHYQLATPFYIDFVVDSDDFGFINVSIGPRFDSLNKTAFLNGLEIMELLKDFGPDPKRSEPTKKRLFVIIGSIVGGVAFIFILMGVVLFACKCRKTKSVETLDAQSMPLYGGSSYSRINGETTNAAAIHNLNLGLRLPFAEILHATDNFNIRLMIGEGGFGKVYKGTLRSGRKVAVKRSEPGHGQGLPEFETEILILSKIRHRHLVSLIGYCDERSEMVLVYEFMDNGTLRDHLYNLNEDSKRSSIQSQLSWNQRLEICIGAAKGLQYLHSGTDGGIFHRDVKSTNILLDKNYVAKVADFGLSRSSPLDKTHVSTDVKGSFGYLDPEYFRCLHLTQKSDVYSFGVVMLEVLCARPAINNQLPREQVNLADWGLTWQKKGQLERILDPFLVGKINPNSLRKFGEMVEKCLKEYGVDRPNMIDVLWDLEYAVQLQQGPVLREPYEESTTDVSWELQLPVVHHLPSHRMAIDEDEDEIPRGINDSSDTSYTNASEVFSQLRIDDAR